MIKSIDEVIDYMEEHAYSEKCTMLQKWAESIIDNCECIFHTSEQDQLSDEEIMGTNDLYYQISEKSKTRVKEQIK